jgi:chromosome segregation ATPase
MNQKKIEIEAIKKEYAELQTKLNSAKSEHSIAKSTLDDLNEANMELATIRSQISQHKEELEKLKSRPTQSIDLEQVTEKYEQVKAELAKAKAEVDLARQQLQYLKDESENKKHEIEATKKELKLLENDLSSAGRVGASKNVIEAASAVVAATNTKLQKAQKEIEVLKQTLERERIEYIKTKKQLDEIQKSKKQKS